MQTFIKVYFWMLVFGMVADTLIMSTDEFPRVVEHGIGYYIARVLTTIPFMLWAAYLIWA